ncbi:RNA polymerase sigma factor [Idiomarina xiamenensis]|uniref:DNA-directed RNA polymerase specialized sigma factor n=1 Tax=Idiomarina xiamenensis 10-D-4 TaxID=740709 RepID=K2KCJ8_9GAMM|nr:sigma-70 family RNA polymerase sigma factor [Idiomarina xiamenensis]EKE84387.1 DNA-directed RNA polymerase specialized sigma factor [Idiomarina xiamenensis 10-D-4]
MNKLTAFVDAAAAGDQAAFAELVERTQNLVASVALSIVKDVRASEEVAQETFLLAWRKLHLLRRRASFLPWLRQMTRHCAYQWLAKEHPARYSPVGDDIDQQLQQWLDEDADTASAQVQQRQQQRILQQALEQLTAENRDIVILFYREQQSTTHVAQLLGLSESCVRQRLSRARRELATDLLQRVAKAALLTAPTLSVSTILAGSLTLFSPPAAALGWSSLSAAATQGGLKWLLLPGIMCIAIFTAVVGVFIGSHQAQRYAKSFDDRLALQRLRNRASVFVALTSCALFGSYEVSQGWQLPSSVYILLLGGIIYYQIRIQRHIQSPQKRWRWATYLGYIIGFGGGIAGLIGGFLLSGRL